MENDDYIQNINSINISFNKSLINYNDLYFFNINTKYIKTIKNNRQINIAKLFIDVNGQTKFLSEKKEYNRPRHTLIILK